MTRTHGPQSYTAIANVARLVGRAASITSASALVALVGATRRRETLQFALMQPPQTSSCPSCGRLLKKDLLRGACWLRRPCWFWGKLSLVLRLLGATSPAGDTSLQRRGASTMPVCIIRHSCLLPLLPSTRSVHPLRWLRMKVRPRLRTRDDGFSTNMTSAAADMLTRSKTYACAVRVGMRNLTRPRTIHRARDASCLAGACVEFVGIVARAVGSSFVTHPQMLPSVLTPVLEKLGDPDREVSTTRPSSLLARCGFARLPDQQSPRLRSPALLLQHS